MTIFLIIQDIYSGCCTVAAQTYEELGRGDHAQVGVGADLRVDHTQREDEPRLRFLAGDHGSTRIRVDAPADDQKAGQRCGMKLKTPSRVFSLHSTASLPLR